MNTRAVFPELRRYLDEYDTEEAADRLPELMAYREPFAITADSGRYVMVPAAHYDDLVASMIALTTVIEQRRQAAEPLPPL